MMVGKTLKRLRGELPALVQALVVTGVAADIGVAQARPTYSPSVVLSLGTGYSRNPYLFKEKETVSDVNGDPVTRKRKLSTAKLNAEIAPNLTIESTNQQIDLRGFYRFVDYTRGDYNTENGYGVSGNGRRTLSANLAMNAYAGYERSRVGTYNGSDIGNFIPEIGGTGSIPQTGGTGTTILPGQQADPSVAGDATSQPAGPVTDPGDLDGFDPGDIGLVGQRRYRTNFRAGGGLNGKLNPRTDWNVGFSANRSRYSRQNTYGNTNYWTYTPTFGINRLLSATNSVGFQMTVSRVDYANRLGDSWIYSPQLVGRFRLSDSWSINGGIGFSVTRRHRILDGKRNTVNFSGEGTLCRSQVRTTFCLGGSHNAGVTGVGGVSEVTSAYATYGYKLTERSSIGATARFYRNSGARGIVGVGDQRRFDRSNYLSGGLSYEHQLSQRLRVVASAAYADVYRRRSNVRSDVTGQVSLVFDTGRIR